MNIITIIVTPDFHRFQLVLTSVSEQVNRMVIVDNGSSGRSLGRLRHLGREIFEKAGVFHGYTP